MQSPPSISEYSRRRHPDRLTVAWSALIGLSLASTGLTVFPLASNLIGGGILLLALFKARIILARYLELENSPGWLRGFTMVLCGFSAVIFVLYLV